MDGFQEQIQRVIARLSGDPEARVGELRRHTQGFSLETVSFEASWLDDGTRSTRRLVLRREPQAGLLEPYDLEPQVRAMQAVAAVVPVPEVLWFESDPTVLDRPFYVVSFVEGDVPLPNQLGDGSLPITEERIRNELAEDFAGNLASLHRFDWRASALVDCLSIPNSPAEVAQDQVDFWAQTVERSEGPPMPLLTRALRQLRRSAPTDTELSLVHGDYRTGNFLRREGKITAVLDWELVHIGDPMEDLAWAAARMWRGNTDKPGLLVERSELFNMYLRSGGVALDQERLAFYDTLAAVKMIAIMLTGLRAFEQGRTDDARMAIFNHQLAGMNMILAESLGLVGSLSE